MQENYAYYAFISYSHRDRAYATWLQKSLERSRIPAAVHRSDDTVPRKISPIFRDDTDLVTHGSLANALTEELQASRYLILICSPASAQSDWVNNEVKAFIRLGRADRIIPVIVDGELNSGTPETECFPPALRELERGEEPLCIDVREHGKHGAYLRVIASLLQIRLDQIVRRDRKLRRKRFALTAAVAALVLVVAAFLVWFNVPFTSLYRDYTYRWDKPVGISRITAAEQANRSVTYRFTTRRGRVEKVERLNAQGILTDGEIAYIWTEPAEIRFRYADEGLFGGQVIGKDYFNTNGRKLYSLQYTREDGTGRRAADLIMPGEGVSAFSDVSDTTNPQSMFLLATEDTTDLSALAEDRTVISRYLQTYDADGYIIRKLYMKDNWNHPASDNNGVSGLGYSYDSVGRIIRIDYLDPEGKIHADFDGCAGETFEYDDAGNLIRETRLDENGTPLLWSMSYVTQECEFDEYGRVRKMVCLNHAGRPMASIDYFLSAGSLYGRDENGNISSTVFLDTNLNPAANYSGVTEIRRTFDEKGRITGEQCLDGDGNPVPDYSGIPVQSYTYDEKGNLLTVVFTDGNGQKVWCSNPNCTGFVFDYTEEGQVREIRYLDADGAPDDKGGVVNLLGYSIRENVYNQAGQLERIRYLNDNRDPVQAANGAWQVHFTYEDAAMSRMTYEDADGNITLIQDGYAIYELLRSDGIVVGGRCLDTEGQPIAALGDTYAAHMNDYNNVGQLEGIRYLDDQGSPVMINDGYAAIQYRWDQPSDNFMHWLDTEGNEVNPDPEEAARKARNIILFRITYVMEDSPGALAGLRQWDIIIRYNDWNYGKLYRNMVQAGDGLVDAISAARESEKHITVARHGSNGWEAAEVTAPAGMSGFAWEAFSVSTGFTEQYLVPLCGNN